MRSRLRPANGALPGVVRLSQTFRLPQALVESLRAEAATGGRDLTAQVVRTLDGVRTHFGLPEAATTLLEADRAQLGMERCEYLLHLLFQRSLELRRRGPGFDAPSAPLQLGGGGDR